MLLNISDKYDVHIKMCEMNVDTKDLIVLVIIRLNFCKPTPQFYVLHVVVVSLIRQKNMIDSFNAEFY